MNRIAIAEEPAAEAKTRNNFKSGVRHNSVVMTRTTKNNKLAITPNLGDNTLTERKYNMLNESA